MQTAIRETLGINGGTGAAQFSCLFCYETGEFDNRFRKMKHSLLVPRSLANNEPLLRTQESYLSDAQQAMDLGEEYRGVHYLSPFEKLPYWDTMKQSLADPMHCGAGPMKGHTSEVEQLGGKNQ